MPQQYLVPSSVSSTMQSKLQFEVILSQTYSLFSLKLRIFGRNNFEQLFLLVFKRMLANKGKIRPAFYYLVLLIMFNFESHIQIDINIESLINEVSNNDIHEIINKNKSSLMTTIFVRAIHTGKRCVLSPIFKTCFFTLSRGILFVPVNVKLA